MTRTLISTIRAYGSDIILNVEDRRFRVHDYYNDFECSFPTKSLGKVVEQLNHWSTSIYIDVNTAQWFNNIGYRGNWIKTKRIPHIIKLLSENIKFKKRSKSELKRLATSTIIKEYSLLKALVDTKK